LKESAKLGFDRAWLPAGIKAEGIALNGFRSLGSMVDFQLGRG